jgi:L,D-peptidoglycan transpeptidase YkuD (ErfK/YbiS/YcfS/YnhG family)
MAKIPATTTQVVLAVGAGTDQTTTTVSLWERSGQGWRQVGAPMAAHNGAKGWTPNHRQGDLRTPAGVYTLTAAGGRLADPGTALPYEYRPSYYQISGTFLGGNLAGAFDYVVGIDYNHVPGSPPSDSRKPQGAAAGGGIWFHVDHNSPTHGCVSLSAENMQVLLRWLDPAKQPVTVMGSPALLT